MTLPLCAFFLSVLLTRLMVAFNIQDIPQERSSHTEVTPRAGGLAIVVAFSCFFALNPFLQISPFLAGAIFVLAFVHLWDDIYNLAYRWRFLAQFICALVVIWQGFLVQLTELPLAISYLLTFSGLVFIINATNFIDGLNGLLTGTVTIGTFCFWGLLYLIPETQNSPLIPLTQLFTAALLGFFIFNFPRARIFMGDVGSTFLGLFIGLAALCLQDYFPGQTALGFFNRGFVLALFPLGFVWFDVAFTLLRRLYLKRPLTQAHRDHLFQILHRCGYSHVQVSGLYFLLTTLLSIITLLSATHLMNFTYGFILYAVLQAFLVWRTFAQAKQHGLPA